jgi:hypothetical protein
VTADERRRQARAARAVVEDGLGPDIRTWPWSLGASRLLDLWLLAEDGDS